jgi:hypothetical protein
MKSTGARPGQLPLELSLAGWMGGPLENLASPLFKLSIEKLSLPLLPI